MSGWENKMDDKLLQVREYTDEGYRPLVQFNDWRVAILNYIDEIHPDKNQTMERHTLTDEVFVLLHGQASLIIGGNESGSADISPLRMDHGKLYNVRRNTWHTILMSRDASILLVENRDTGESNTEFIRMPQSSLEKMQSYAKDEGFAE